MTHRRPIVKIDAQVWWRLPQKIRFLVVGGYNTVFGYLVFAALYLALGHRIHYLIVGSLAHLIALVNAFVVHRRLVFGSTGQWYSSFFRFSISQLAAFCVGLCGLYVLVEFVRLRPLWAQALVTSMSVALTYCLHRYFSFRQHPNAL
jgi:putative flippase GtrA